MRYFNNGFTMHPPLTVNWSLSDKSSNITLSSGLLTATALSAADGAVRATYVRSSGKHYAELNMVTVTGGDTGGGFANASAVLANIGGSVAGAVIQFKGGNVYNNGTLLFGNGNISGGGILRVAYDAAAHRVWIAFAGGNWNNSGSADPGTGVGGIDVSAWDSGGLFPCFSCGATADQCTANFGATTFTYSLPSGYSNWSG